MKNKTEKIKKVRTENRPSSAKKWVTTLGVFSGAIAMTACSAPFQSLQPNIAKKVADNIDDSLGCKNFEESLWKSFYESVENSGKPPSAADVESAMKLGFENFDRISKVSEESREQITRLTADIATTVLARTDVAGDSETDEAGSESENGDKATGDDTDPGRAQSTKPALMDDEQIKGLWLQRIAQLEIGDRTTPEKSSDVDRVRDAIEALKSVAGEENLVDAGCETPTETPSTISEAGLFAHWKETYALPVYGGLKTFATLYQSCEAATRKPLGDEFSGVKGISVTGRHSSGGGNVRVVSDLKALIGNHPYIGNGIYKRPLPSCHDVQKAPSIYDYGGKPFTSTSNEKVMNMFKNGGSGSKELGIDCSAMVYAAYATVGLKFKKETSLKATLVNGVSSSMLAEPQRNGLTCLDHAPFTSASNLVPGDIISIKGHVVLVADVGRDPLGIASINSISDCKSSNMNVSRFNFSIFQSSPSKGSIGMNRMRARDYLSNFSTMGLGMIDHAVNACKAKFQTKAVVSKSTRASVIRHLGTAGCSDPQPIVLSKEECLSSCAPRSLDSI